MKSITVHGIDKVTEKLINERAKSAGTSVNKIVKELLAKALGLDKDRIDHREEFMDLFGAWTEEEEKEFLEAVREMLRISFLAVPTGRASL
jgi:predicted HicB family RNase H-like nuclease